MEIRTYRAQSMQEAIELVRSDLGPDASVLHTRRVAAGVLGWVTGGKAIEVTASAAVDVPSRFEDEQESLERAVEPAAATGVEDERFGDGAQFEDDGRFAPYDSIDTPPKDRGAPTDDGLVEAPLIDVAAYQRRLSRIARQDIAATEQENPSESPQPDPEPAREDLQLSLYAELLDAELNEADARELLDRCKADWNRDDRESLLRRMSGMVEEDIRISGAIRTLGDHPRVVALVGPTGVGKTTTIAKLAANFRLREQLNVGLITVDTYRIAAVDQLKTYANIMNLPMKVVASQGEMRNAIDSMSDVDLILMDTAGRSPKDELKIRELRSMLTEAEVDEVHLVLSCNTSVRSLTGAARRFQDVGASSLVLTKLDEAEALGGLLPLLRESRLPLSYVTDGQNVPDDIQVASARRLADRIVGREKD